MEHRFFLVLTLSFSLLQAWAGQHLWPGADWLEAGSAESGLDERKLVQARDYALSAGGSGLIVHRGKVVLRWGDQEKLYDIKSATKSVGATALGVAIGDGKIKLNARAEEYHRSFGVPPESNKETGWLSKITIHHLATHTTGFEKPGGFGKLLCEPGTKWIYSDGGPNWLAECITLSYRRDIGELMFERIFAPIGITRQDLRWRRNAYRPHEIEGIPRREFGAGVHANVNALARIGYLYLREGEWNGTQLLHRDFIRIATTPSKEIAGLPENDAEQGNASEHYGLLWWNNGDGALQKVPRDAYWAWGLYDSLILVIPSLDLVVARGGENGKSWPREKASDHYDVLKGFYEPIVAAVATSNGAGLPYPPSEVIASIEWAPTNSIIRKARGSDNWPITWGDDGALYAAYGDGSGFEPLLDKKLSLGFARILGGPSDFRGLNIRSNSEQIGEGAKGMKASGMLMVDRILYMLVRNAGNSQLAWSSDYGKTWTWADWKFSTSFGCPTFLNFGANYKNARDKYVYLYSHDSDSAYESANSMVLARVPQEELRRRDAYRFLSGFGSDGHPVWTEDIRERKPVFTHPGNCYRSGISYHPVLRRYLWVQILPQSEDARGPRFQGGFGIYDAPDPWGPWTTVFLTRSWDVGPGETASFPAKWMSDDGRTLHLVFSGDDHFSVRKATIVLRSNQGKSASDGQ
jgi:CubicO group peptidase (beta-lactamase class C family)